MGYRDGAMYLAEEWTDDEAEVLRRYFTNLDGPVFALVNLPEVVKGALFARYSRSAKSLRRLFLDEFVGDLDVSGDHGVDATVGLARAEALYEKVFFEYGDDSVAQLGGVHLACEQASNLLTKVLERGRLMSYMEKSTRYVSYGSRLPNGRYRYYRDPAILDSSLGARYVGDMDRLFDSYAGLLPVVGTWLATRFPKESTDSDLVWRQSIRAKAFDALRGILPAASSSNLGIYGSGQAYEALLVRMRSHPLAEARFYAELILEELRKVIPSWVRRVDVEDRGGAWSAYMEKNSRLMQDAADALVGSISEIGDSSSEVGEAGDPEVDLLDWDPDAELKMVAAMLYPYTHLSDRQLLERVERLSDEDRLEIVRRYVGERANRRYRPGRALERSDYRFDVISDYGAFRDLQRHRLLCIEWQDLSPRHGYTVPAAVRAAGVEDLYKDSMLRSAGLYEALEERFGPASAGYAVALAFRVRYVMQMNIREAMHLIELRTSPQGHPEYRRVAQAMHRLIAEKAGHRAVAEMMSFADHADYSTESLERLAGERRAAERQAGVRRAAERRAGESQAAERQAGAQPYD